MEEWIVDATYKGFVLVAGLSIIASGIWNLWKFQTKKFTTLLVSIGGLIIVFPMLGPNARLEWRDGDEELIIITKLENLAKQNEIAIESLENLDDVIDGRQAARFDEFESDIQALIGQTSNYLKALTESEASFAQETYSGVLRTKLEDLERQGEATVTELRSISEALDEYRGLPSRLNALAERETADSLDENIDSR